MNFIDEVTIYIQSGRGGKGCESYFRRTDKKLVPNGGDGGRGGNVVIRADRNETSLYSFRFNKHFRAESGHPGSSNQKKGRDGEDLVIRVPCGTVIYSKADRLMIRDLAREGDEVMALRGGKGGLGNHHHGRMATSGEGAQGLDIVMSLKLAADVFLIGSPNAGKSLLLNFLTGAKAKSEGYPFSTQSPQLGIFETKDYRSISLCELPSLIKGSAKGKALGNQFLKHLARARLLFLMLDPSVDAFDPLSGYNELMDEISAFAPEYRSIPHFLLLSKIDLPDVKEKVSGMKANVPCPRFLISGKTGEGLESLMEAAQALIFQTAKES